MRTTLRTYLQDTLNERRGTQHLEEALLGPACVLHVPALVAVFGEGLLLATLGAVDADEDRTVTNVVVTSS